METLIQGCSFQFDYTSENVTPPYDGNWTGTLALTSTIGGDPIVTKPITPAADQLGLTATFVPADTLNVEPGTYHLTARIINNALGVRDEIQDTIEIVKKGFPG